MSVDWSYEQKIESPPHSTGQNLAAPDGSKQSQDELLRSKNEHYKRLDEMLKKRGDLNDFEISGMHKREQGSTNVRKDLAPALPDNSVVPVLKPDDPRSLQEHLSEAIVSNRYARKFERDKEGRIRSIEENGRQVWHSDDGRTFRNVLNGETITGQLAIGKDGSYRFILPEGREILHNPDYSLVFSDRNGTVTIGDDGRQILRNQRGALLATSDGAGRLTRYEPLDRNPNEQPTRIVLQNGKTWEKVDDNLWKDPKTGELLNGSWTLAANGDLSLKSATGKDSVTFKFDGSTVSVNEKGLVSQIQNKDGKATHYFYNEQDKLRAMQLPNGTRWTNTSGKTWVKEGSTETWIGTRSIDCNGVLHLESGGVTISRGTDGWERRVSDKGTVTLERDNGNGSHVVKNELGQIVEIRDAIGNSRTFEYGNHGQVVRITNPNGSAWSSQDGSNWTRDGSRPPETREGQAQLSDDGTCRSVGVGLEGYETVLRGDGSKLKVEAGNIVSMTTARGETYHYQYGTDGKLNSVQWPDRNGNIWRTEDGKLWRQFDKDGKFLNREKTGEASVNPDGSLKQSQLEGDIVAVRIFKTDGTIYDTFNDWTQRGQKDGSTVFTDRHDRVVRLIDKNGRNTEYGYDDSGRLNRINRPDGTEYTSTNGYSWVGTKLAGNTYTESKFEARIEIMQDGTEKQHLSNGNDLFLHTNGAATVHERGLVTVYDNHDVEKAKITETIDRDGNHKLYKYGSVTRNVGGKTITVPDQLTAFQDKNGKWMLSTDGFNWQSNDRETTWKGVAILHSDGSLQRIGERGYDTTERTDGTFLEKQRTDLQAAAKSMVDILSWSVTTSYHERSEKVEQALSGRSAAEVQIIKRLFEQQWNKDGGTDDFESILRDRLSGHQIEKGLAHLERRDDANFSEVKADDAGRIHTALEELGQSWRGRWASNITEDLRSTLSKLNAEQIRQLKDEYQRRFNEDLGHALLTHPKVKDDRFTSESFRIYLLGNDQRCELSMLRLIRLAYQEGNIDRFEEATRNASQKAREQYIEENGGLKLTISRLQDKFGGIFSDRDFFHARDTIRYGRITEATTIQDATGTFSNDEKTIDKVLREMPEERRAMFFRGEYLSRHPDEIKNKKDQEARDLYRNLSQSFREAYSWAADLRIAQLRDQVRVEGGGLIKELGQHGGAIYASNVKDIVNSVQNLSKKQWDALIGDPDYRKRMEQELRQFLGDTKVAAVLEVIDRKLTFKSQLELATKEQLIALHHFSKMPPADLERFIQGREASRLIDQHARNSQNKVDPFKRHELEKELAQKALHGDREANDKMRALEFYRDEVYKAQKSGARRDVQKSLDDTKGDPKLAIEAILKMTPEERDKYRHNTGGFRTELETKVEVVLRKGTQSYETALSLLKQVETSKTNEPPKMEIIDKLRMMTYDAGRKRGDVVREIDLALKENPELRKRLQSDLRFAREFESATKKAFRDDLHPRLSYYDQFVKPILKDESYLPADLLIRLHRPQGSLDRQGLTSHLLAMSPETLHKLNSNSKERDRLIDALNSEDRQVVDRILRQATPLTERKSALLETAGAQNRTSVEKIIAQGGPRSDQEQKLVSSLNEADRDTLDKLAGDWQKGPATAADKMRLFVINAGVNSQQVKDLLGLISLDQKRTIFQEYAAKYGLNDLKRDLLQRAEASDRPQIEYLCRTERLSAGERYNLALTAATTSDGLSSDLMKYTHYGASRTDMRQVLTDLQKEIADANRAHRPLDRKTVDKLEASFREALVNFRESKEQFADSVVNSVITVTAFAAAPFTGGASLYPILYAMAAGATLKLGTHMIVSGADFEATTANISRKLAAGMVEGGFAAINPGQIGALVGLGERAGLQAAKAVSAQLGTNLLKEEGKQLLEAEMKKLIGSALANRVAGASERELAAVAEKMVERGFIDATRKKALTEMMSQSLETAIREETKTFLKRAQYEFLHATANAAIGAGAAVAGTATDRLLSGTLDGNALRQAGLEGASGGFFMSAFARGIHGLGHVAGVERAGRATQYGFGILQATFSGVAGDVANQGALHGAVDRGAVASSGFNMLAASGIGGAHQLRTRRIPHEAGARRTEGSPREPSAAVRADQPLAPVSEPARTGTAAGTEQRPAGDARQPVSPPELSRFTKPASQPPSEVEQAPTDGTRYKIGSKDIVLRPGDSISVKAGEVGLPGKKGAFTLACEGGRTIIEASPDLEIWINGKRVEKLIGGVLLSPGDQVRIGGKDGPHLNWEKVPARSKESLPKDPSRHFPDTSRADLSKLSPEQRSRLAALGLISNLSTAETAAGFCKRGLEMAGRWDDAKLAEQLKKIQDTEARFQEAYKKYAEQVLQKIPGGDMLSLAEVRPLLERDPVANKEKLAILQEAVDAGMDRMSTALIYQQMIESRRQDLQDLVNDLAKAKGQPEVRVILIGNSNTHGYYQNGEIAVRQSDLLDKTKLPRLLNTALHESIHNADEKLIVSAIADERNVGTIATEAQKDELIKIFRGRGGPEISRERLEEILRVRNGEPLKPGEAHRAELLAKDLYLWQQTVGGPFAEARERLLAVVKQVNQLRDTSTTRAATDLVKKLSDGTITKEQSERLFGVTPPPLAVQKLIENYHDLEAGKLNKQAFEQEAQRFLHAVLSDRLNKLQGSYDLLYRMYRHASFEGASWSAGAEVDHLARKALGLTAESEETGKKGLEAVVRHEEHPLKPSNPALAEPKPGRPPEDHNADSGKVAVKAVEVPAEQVGQNSQRMRANVHKDKSVKPVIPDGAVASHDTPGRQSRLSEPGPDHLNKLVKEAESAKSPEEISAVIERIYTHEDIDAAKEALSRLATGKSEAAPFALTELLIMADSPKDFATAEKLWKSGDIVRWWKEGKLDGCDIYKMTASTDSQLDLSSIFRQAMKQLEDRKDLRVHLCATVAGGGTNLHDPLLGLIAFDRSDTKIPLAVRREAIEQLIKDKPPDLANSLKNIGLAQDDRNLRRLIKEALDKIFEHPAAPQPGEPARPRLLEGKHLERFSAAAESLDWSHPGGVEKRYKAYNKDLERLIKQQDTFESEVTMHMFKKGVVNEDLEGPDLRELMDKPKEMRQLLKDTPDLLHQYESLLTEESRLGSERKFFDAVIADRLQGLQSELSKLLEALHLPPTELKAKILDEKKNGTYSVGMNQFRIHERGLLTDRHPKPDIINTIMHEATHHDQADIVTRWVLDRERVGKTIESNEQLKRVKEQFLSETGRELDEKFINQVLRTRDGLALNDRERNRAKALASAFLDKAQSDSASKAAEKTASQLEKHITFLRKGAPVVVVLGNDLKNTARMLRLFGANEAPARIQDLTKQLNEIKNNSVESTKLHEQLRAEIIKELSSRMRQLMSKQHQEYRSRYHEVETFKVGGRAGYLADFYSKERKVDKP